MTPDAPTAVSVVIGTRNRPSGAARAVCSILRGRSLPKEIIVVDQGNAAVPEWESVGDSVPVRTIRDDGVGLSRARNLGVAHATGGIVAFTDDDCEVGPDWLASIAYPFAGHPDVGVVLGCVRAAPYDRSAGFTPAYEVAREFTGESIGVKASIEGIGACMAVRRATWQRLGGFDELLGAGAPFRAGDETDFVNRALLRRIAVHETRRAVVLHHGFRTWTDGLSLIEGYMFGLGATYAKFLRLGRQRAIRPLATLAWRWLAGRPVVDLNHRPPRLSRLSAFLRGWRAGMATPVEPTTGRFAG